MLLAYSVNSDLLLDPQTETELYQSPKGQFFKLEVNRGMGVTRYSWFALLDVNEAIALFNQLIRNYDFNEAFPDIEFTEG